ncbi:cullin-associated NEDD8-dissociated protein 1-like [Hordeum vulgare subsp. vulgare]|uniref:cullin-associated NEDD8-dissociated protein 1-like n=1 Tax=Hordeum vulgare subsp. vulgare TaxID=112509 RepID=UPI001D1A4682|nr:cullin-associated NEDD8-dissociated protein 1-like [Hordeum vulgare subsp. vulgare]
MRGARSSRGRGAPRRRWRPGQRGGCSGGFTCGRGSRGTCVPRLCRPCRRPRSGGRRRGSGGGRRARIGCKWRKGWSAGCRPGASAGRFCWRRRAREEGAGVVAILSCCFCRWHGPKEGTETGQKYIIPAPGRVVAHSPTSANKGARKYITPGTSTRTRSSAGSCSAPAGIPLRSTSPGSSFQPTHLTVAHALLRLTGTTKCGWEGTGAATKAKELPSCLPILVDRMGNEITRLTTVKTFAVIADSPLRIDLSCVLDHVISELTTFLRKANRALGQATLGTLNSLVVTYGGQIGSSSYETIIAELSTLISDIDLHMAALALELCCIIMVDRRSIKNVGLAVRHKVLPHALILIRSALLQGQALQKFFASLVQSANTSFETLLDSHISTAKPSQSGGLSKQALSSIAQCVAVLCLAAGDQKCASTVEMLKGILNDDSSTNSLRRALLLFGKLEHCMAHACPQSMKD